MWKQTLTDIVIFWLSIIIIIIINIGAIIVYPKPVSFLNALFGYICHYDSNKIGIKAR